MTVSAQRSVGYGLVGCGAFGRFCLEQYRSLEGLACVAVADAKADAARSTARDFALEACASPAELMARDDVDCVHIATPPSTHREVVLAALHAGKHVLCEKPLATQLKDAREMTGLSRDKKRVLAVNLIMRHNPLCERVKHILEERLLGEPLHAFFENYAKDEPLPPGHWFWDRELSGGIFIEHGVHFFDLFRWWLGEGDVLAAQQTRRPGSDLIEQVHCTARYGEAVLVDFYHGFHQASRMDRQEMRIVCERGDIRLFEWVPTRIEIDALADRETLARLEALVPRAKARALESCVGHARAITSRHKPYSVDGRYLIHGDVGMSKPDLYGQILRGLLADQLAAMRDPDHARRVTERDGLTSLEMAVRADDLARDQAKEGSSS